MDYAPELEGFLRQAGKDHLIEKVHDIADRARIFYIRQKVQRGLGDAIRIGRRHIAGEPFAVLLGDTIIQTRSDRPGLRQLLDAYEAKQSSVVAVHKVPREWVNRYGIVAGQEEKDFDSLYRLDHLVEKPNPDEAPSDLAIAGRYVFSSTIFECIDKTKEGVGNEIQLTDAMNLLATQEPVYALDWQAKRYDIGNRVEYTKCFIDYALAREDTREAVLEHLRKNLDLIANTNEV